MRIIDGVVCGDRFRRSGDILVYTRKRRWRLLGLCPLVGTAFTGCWATVTQNLDILLAPSASANLLALPGSPVGPLLEFLLRALRG